MPIMPSSADESEAGERGQIQTPAPYTKDPLIPDQTMHRLLRCRGVTPARAMTVVNIDAFRVV